MTKIQHLESKNDVEKINEYINDGKHLFILVYMNGCQPCSMTKPHWMGMETHPKLKDVLAKGNVEIVYVEQSNQDAFKDRLNEIRGYPSIQYIHRGKKVDYNGERTEDAFLSWMLQMLDDADAGKNAISRSPFQHASRSKSKSRSRGRSGGSGLGCTACSGSSGVGVVDGVGSGLFSGGRCRRTRHTRHRRRTQRRHRHRRQQHTTMRRHRRHRR